ncbi:helix-turn-helix domain-containing protein [Hymenobacter nivis]|nr:helix-turn-helix transcriptional regulator [Hymenobacter nivis]
MALHCLSSDSVVADVRRHFGLSQQELAGWLGVSNAQAGHLETGRRALAGDAAEALAPLVARLPLPGAVPVTGALRLASAALPALALAPPDAAPLAARLDYCQHHARRLRRALVPLEAQAATAARWAAALPALRAALPPDPGPAAAPDPATAWPAWQAWHRHRWLDQRPPALPPDLSARYHLLRLQAEALEAEAAALAALLPR